MGFDLADTVANQTLLVNLNGVVCIFEERVQAVKDRRVAEISVLENDPLSCFDGFDQDGVLPLENRIRCAVFKVFQLLLDF